MEPHRVVVVGKLALTCSEYLKKGRQFYVEGRIRTREFENKVDAREQRRTEIGASRCCSCVCRPTKGFSLMRLRRRRYPPIRRFHSDPLRRFVVDTRFARHLAIEDGEKGEDQESFLAIDDRLRDSMS